MFNIIYQLMRVSWLSFVHYVQHCREPVWRQWTQWHQKLRTHHLPSQGPLQPPQWRRQWLSSTDVPKQQRLSRLWENLLPTADFLQSLPFMWLRKRNTVFYESCKLCYKWEIIFLFVLPDTPICIQTFNFINRVTNASLMFCARPLTWPHTMPTLLNDICCVFNYCIF